MKKISPRQAKTIKVMCSLESDNKNVASGWILLDQGRVILKNQRHGESPTGGVEFTRQQFNALIDWYNRPQSTSACESK